MFLIKRNSAGQHQVIFAQSKKVAATYPNRTLCVQWLELNYPEWVPGNAAEVLRKATERAMATIKTALAPPPTEYRLNASTGAAVWRGR